MELLKYIQTELCKEEEEVKIIIGQISESINKTLKMYYDFFNLDNN